jgi:hypothetical protein
MGVSVIKGHFTNKEAAVNEILARGRFSRDGAMSAGDLEDVHWHKTGLEIFILEGSFETKDVASETLLEAGPGDLIRIPAQTLHAARCPIPAVYVVGFESAEAAAKFRPEKPEDLA